MQVVYMVETVWSKGFVGVIEYQSNIIFLLKGLMRPRKGPTSCHDTASYH